MRSLTDKVIVITGASRGIGLAIARHCAAEQARLVINGSNQKNLDDAVAQLDLSQRRLLAVAADLRKRSEMKKLIDAAWDAFGVIDIFINNAGVGARKQICETTEEEFDWMFDVNVRAVYHCFVELLPLYRRQGFGQIINMSSGAARTGVPHMAVYAGTKAALNIMTESVANEVRNENIKVSLVSPGSTETTFGQGHTSPAAESQRSAVRLTTDEVAEAVVCLAKQNQTAFTFHADVRPLRTKP